MKDEKTFIKVMSEINRLQERQIEEAEKAINEARIKAIKAKEEVKRKLEDISRS